MLRVTGRPEWTRSTRNHPSWTVHHTIPAYLSSSLRDGIATSPGLTIHLAATRTVSRPQGAATHPAPQFRSGFPLRCCGTTPFRRQSAEPPRGAETGLLGRPQVAGAKKNRTPRSTTCTARRSRFMTRLASDTWPSADTGAFSHQFCLPSLDPCFHEPL